MSSTNVFLHELRAYRTSALVWALSLSAMAVLFLCMFPGFTKDIAASQKILGQLPQALRDALDISLKSFFTIYGFFSYLFTFVGLAGAIQAMNLGVGVISKEDSSKTTDFLLTKPIRRSSVITSKLLAAAVLLVFTNLVFSAASLTAAKLVAKGDVSSQTFLLISATLPLIQLFFLGLGALMAVVIPRVKSVVAVTLPTVFAFFIIATLGAILGNTEVRYLTPFKFFDSNYIIAHNSYEWRFVVLEAVLVAVAIAATYVVYTRKDMRAVS